MAEYAQEFNKMEKFAPINTMVDDGFKACRFQDCLKEPIREKVRVFDLKILVEMVNKAYLIEEGIFQREQDQKNRLKLSNPQVR